MINMTIKTGVMMLPVASWIASFSAQAEARWGNDPPNGGVTEYKQQTTVGGLLQEMDDIANGRTQPVAQPGNTGSYNGQVGGGLPPQAVTVFSCTKNIWDGGTMTTYAPDAPDGKTISYCFNGQLGRTYGMVNGLADYTNHPALYTYVDPLKQHVDLAGRVLPGATDCNNSVHVKASNFFS
jgi:hypothetical protein